MNMPTIIKCTGLMSLVLLVQSCAHPRYLTDETFGDTVREARLRQTINPNAGRTLSPPRNLEGDVAKAAVDRYQKSFEKPQEPVNVFTIGVGSGGPSGTQK